MFLIRSAREWNLRQIARFAGFMVVAALIWGAYFYWRPPAPMLGIRFIEHLGSDNPQVSLTFDDAPHPLTTPLLLASLEHAGVKGTFFVVGDGMRLYPELTRRIAKSGNRFANHSQYHNNLTRVTPAEYPHEVDACFTAIKRAGQETQLFRPPGGGLDRDVMDYLYRSGTTLAWWSNNPGDWARPPAWKLATQVKARMRPGDIILLHDAGPDTAQALFSIVKEARSQGLQIVPMPEIQPKR
jgi:peptidoglycan/xylan/chitin deacetylase (PgdA/CDA1 family)